MPGRGGFGQRDPARSGSNWYGYANGGPTNITDPTGLRSATDAERRVWLSFFEHYLPRKFLNNYMDDTGNPIKLSEKEMRDTNPIVDIRNSDKFKDELKPMLSSGSKSKVIHVSGWGGAMTNGTLGNFQINYDGRLMVSKDRKWRFVGVMDFVDYWDFDPKAFGGNSNRPYLAELKVRVATLALPGKPFNITSVHTTLKQSSDDSNALWVGSNPIPVGDRLKKGGADIVTGAAGGLDVGGEVGSAVGGPLGAGALGDIGDVGGGEAGAQTFADIHRKGR